jgi:uncharacterized protein DUF6879
VSFFDQFERSAWRLETHPFYAPDAEEFQRHLDGLPPTAEQRERRRRWVEGLAGREVGRVLLVAVPLSPYWRWRLETAREHAAAGEDIRVALAGDVPGLPVNVDDFWILDDRITWTLAFDYAGRYLGMSTYHDPAMLAYRRRQRDLALAHAVPLQEFLLPA